MGVEGGMGGGDGEEEGGRGTVMMKREVEAADGAERVGKGVKREGRVERGGRGE